MRVYRKLDKIPRYKLGIGVGLIIIGLIGLVVAGTVYFNQPGPPYSVDVVSAPSSIKPSPRAIATYNVPPADPKYISIPSLGIKDTQILKLGLMSDGAIATPDNIYDAGWYDGSSRSGEDGAIFIYGHVSSWTADGVFYNLKKLVSGDSVVITRGDNSTYTYTVVSSKIYPYKAVDMNQVLSPISANVPGLNLMTCTGQVIAGTSQFNERLVVFTSLTSSN